MKTVAFRVEGGGNIGMGHIMRCLSLAREFLRQGCDVFFISSMNEARVVIENNGLKLVKEHEMTSLTNNSVSKLLSYMLKKEAAAISENMYLYESDILILDSYNVNEEYMKLLKENIKHLIYIDDINKFQYPVDIIINGNITGCFMNYPVIEGQKLLLGTEYNLIREEFKNISPKTVDTKIKNIMLTTGGSDPYNCSLNILQMIIDYSICMDITTHVVVGSAFIHEKELNEFTRKHKKIILHKNVKDISKLMILSDLAISAGGSTLYELCACGVPTLAFIMADNQEFIVQKMDELGYVKSLGWYHKIKKNELLQYMDFLNKEIQFRMNLSSEMQRLIDGKGTMRVVKNILEFIDLQRM